jgi:3-hydroxyisobutyrate dehydrogenase-like beta-hydroxyacid dehydrogenase
VSSGRDPRPAVGLIGLGNMGTAIAGRLLAADCDLAVHNRSLDKAEPLRAAGARVFETAAALAEAVDVVLTSLADDEALESVAANIVSGARPGTLLVDLSTVSPAASARVAALIDEAELLYLRAPVSGNPSVVQAGNLTFIVSGPREALERAEPTLLTIGRSVHEVGEAEQARVVKLAINLVIGGLAELMAEALVLSEASEVSRAALLETMGDSAAGAPFVKYKTEPLLRDDYSATFTTRLMEKDVDLVLEEAASAGVPLPLAAELKRRIRAAVAAGYGDDDFMALYLNLREHSTEAVLS